ncbi:hypothetical protein [Bacteroides ovatus]|uniref:hypothetical protein n=1 Tax=Bacteroides ovatus TaxID=28116 RepID=UPI001898614D|nr:hypothetical protein [Bacteroides ovatus]MDC2623414.1 hypothetical protein [Bacteroides ovatus]MDC2637155.1 hypothetical protein [Bacteroides ovatus]MDC2653141.1 hypothetical protein [Bacteroides ovatus]DAP82501.1 MAG TPA: zipper dimerization domain transcription factor-like protein [Caudoviricetes sp.]
MEELKKSREQVLEEQVEKLQKENERLSKDKAMYEGWWRKADAKNAELAESVKAITTIASMIIKQIEI